jgi:hypothetical protein
MFARKPKMMDYQYLANSRRPEWESNTAGSGARTFI